MTNNDSDSDSDSDSENDMKCIGNNVKNIVGWSMCGSVL